MGHKIQDHKSRKLLASFKGITLLSLIVGTEIGASRLADKVADKYYPIIMERFTENETREFCIRNEIALGTEWVKENMRTCYESNHYIDGRLKKEVLDYFNKVAEKYKKEKDF